MRVLQGQVLITSKSKEFGKFDGGGSKKGGLGAAHSEYFPWGCLKSGRYLYVEYRNNVRLSQVNAKSCLNLFHFTFYEVKQVLRNLVGTRKSGRQNISIMLL